MRRLAQLVLEIKIENPTKKNEYVKSEKKS